MLAADSKCELAAGHKPVLAAGHKRVLAADIPPQAQQRQRCTTDSLARMLWRRFLR